jgi:hypothetical protein
MEINLDRSELRSQLLSCQNRELRKRDTSIKAWFDSLRSGIDLAKKCGNGSIAQKLTIELEEFKVEMGEEVVEFWESKGKKNE